MPLDRYIITDRQWGKIEPHCLGKKSDPGRTGGDGRLFLEGVFWIARTGAQWRDLPAEFGKWNSVYRRFRDWALAGVFERIFSALSDEPDMAVAMIDGTIVKVHRHGQGSKGGLEVRPSASRRAAGQPRFSP
jgi:transposase